MRCQLACAGSPAGATCGRHSCKEPNTAAKMRARLQERRANSDLGGDPDGERHVHRRQRQLREARGNVHHGRGELWAQGIVRL